jgi:hypothetical protein
MREMFKTAAMCTRGFPVRRLAACGALALALSALAGCQAGQALGVLMQNEEYQKLVDTPPRYNGLEDKTVAVVVQADMATLYEYPGVVANIAGGVAHRLGRDVPGAQVLHPHFVLNWQQRTPQWNVLPYGEIAEQLNVDRVVFIDVIEYRLNPPGNRYLWEGVCVGRVGVIERGSIDPDAFVDTFDISGKWPTKSAISREDAPPQAVELGVLQEFITQTTWLFHQHLRPKYPDKYRPELDPRNNKKKKK